MSDSPETTYPATPEATTPEPEATTLPADEGGAVDDHAPEEATSDTSTTTEPSVAAPAPATPAKTKPSVQEIKAEIQSVLEAFTTASDTQTKSEAEVYRDQTATTISNAIATVATTINDVFSKTESDHPEYVLSALKNLTTAEKSAKRALANISNGTFSAARAAGTV